MKSVYLVDSHCHLNLLDLTSFHGKLSEMFSSCHEKGVQYFLCVAITLEDHSELVQIANTYPHVAISVGLHPNENPGMPLDEPQLYQFAQHPKVVAIGETGLDYYRQSEPDWQKQRFVQHIACAKRCKKPLIVHTRQAQQDTIAILKAEQADQIGGVLHCFTEDWSMAKQALDLNFYISFSGIVTFKNATVLKEVAKKVPLDRMLIETDSPYLAPHPFRGKTNYPGYVYYVAEYIATLRNESLEKVAEKTTANYFNLFGGSNAP